MNLQKEVDRLSAETGVKAAELTAQINALIKAGKSSEQAVGEWAAGHSYMLNKPEAKEVDFVVVVPGNVVQAATKDGGTASRRFLLGFVLENPTTQEYSLKTILAYGHNADQDYKLGECWRATVTYGKGDIAFVKKDTDIKPSAAKLLKVEDLMKQLNDAGGVLSVREAKGFVGKGGFFKGTVVKVFESKTGGQGCSLYSEGANPVTVWFSGQDKATLGAEVLVYGKVAEKDGTLTIKFASLL